MERVCVVTGAGRGIGRHTAETFARHGARLALCSRSPDDLHALDAALSGRYGAEVYAHPCDVSDPGQVAAFAAGVQERFGRVDVLVNCAGIQGPVGLITDLEPQAWLRALHVNLLGVVHAIRAFVPAMRAAGGGRIITMSGGGLGGSSVSARLSAYTASKAAVLSLTETVAKELAPDGIWINALAPGAINTTFVDAVIEAGPDIAGQALYDATVRQRSGGDSIEKVGEAMLFLASEASGCLTGKLISAKWDPISSLGTQAVELNADDRYTLRRIDGVLFGPIVPPSQP